MKGHKDSDGKFHPHGGTNKAVNLTKQGSVKFAKPVDFKDAHDLIKHKLQSRPEQKVIDVLAFKDLDSHAQEEARDWVRGWINDDNFYAEDEGILYDVDGKGFAGHDVFKNVIPKYWSLNHGGSYIQFDLDFKEGGEKSLLKYLGLTDSSEQKIQATFHNDRGNGEYNTQIKLHDAYGNEIPTDGDYDNYKTHDYVSHGDDHLTKTEFNSAVNAIDKWDALMNKSLLHLQSNYEYSLTDESIDDMIEANEYTFDKDGKREDA